MDSITWNPWHGCHKISEGCRHCYVYREDAAFGTEIASDKVRRTASFYLPLQLNRRKVWKYPAGTEFALCFTSDLLVKEADPWRDEVWEIIRRRSDCRFYFFTKRIDRFMECLPLDWGDGYPNVAVGCTVENQERAEYRLPIFLDAPIRHRMIIAEPLLERLDLRAYLDPAKIRSVTAGGESGKYARPVDFHWITDLRAQCIAHRVPFSLHQTGSFLIKGGLMHHIPREHQLSQARKSGLDWPAKR